MKSLKSLKCSHLTTSNILRHPSQDGLPKWNFLWRPVPCFQTRLVVDEAMLLCKCSRHANFRLEKPQKRQVEEGFMCSDSFASVVDLSQTSPTKADWSFQRLSAVSVRMSGQKSLMLYVYFYMHLHIHKDILIYIYIHLYVYIFTSHHFAHQIMKSEAQTMLMYPEWPTDWWFSTDS